MKIATYNIWNSDVGMPDREKIIVKNLQNLESDVLALQEVKNREYHVKLNQFLNYEYSCFYPHDNYEEGLSIFSNFPIVDTKYIDSCLMVTFKRNNMTISLSNIHLPYNSVLTREKCIVDLIKEVQALSVDYRFIVGDFNCSDNSSVYQYLSGNRSLHGTEVESYWTDLSLVAKEQMSIEREMTLDLMNNPRWKDQRITDVSSQVDYLFIHDCYPKEYPTLVDFKYFGKEIDLKSGFSGSDHYGVFAELKL